MTLEILKRIPEEDLRDPLINRAYMFARKAHEGQKRIQGGEYITHPVAVYNLAKGFTDSKAVLAAALLHDVMEDCGVMRPELLAEFDEETVFIVDTLSKKPGETMNNYLRSLKKHSRKIRLLKVCDRYNNLKEIRLTKHKFFIHRVIRETIKYVYPLCDGLPRLGKELQALVGSLIDEFKFTELKPSVKNTIILGLVGGLVCGKTRILKFLKRNGYRTIDANDISMPFYSPGSVVYDQLLHRFGNGFLLKDGSIDRQRMRIHAFSSKRALNEYSKIIHSHLDKKLWDSINEFDDVKDNMIFYTSSVLLKTVESRCMDYTIYIRCSPTVQITRLMERDGISRSHAEQIIKCQYDLDQIIDNCDFLVKNDGDFQDTLIRFKQVILNIQAYNLMSAMPYSR